MSCTVAREIREITRLHIDFCEAVGVQFRPTACGSAANAPGAGAERILSEIIVFAHDCRYTMICVCSA